MFLLLVGFEGPGPALNYGEDPIVRLCSILRSGAAGKCSKLKVLRFYEKFHVCTGYFGAWEAYSEWF